MQQLSSHLMLNVSVQTKNDRQKKARMAFLKGEGIAHARNEV